MTRPQSDTPLVSFGWPWLVTKFKPFSDHSTRRSGPGKRNCTIQTVITNTNSSKGWPLQILSTLTPGLSYLYVYGKAPIELVVPIVSSNSLVGGLVLSCKESL